MTDLERPKLFLDNDPTCLACQAQDGTMCLPAYSRYSLGAIIPENSYKIFFKTTEIPTGCPNKYKKG